MEQKYPIRTEECPIKDSLLEIRFDTNLFPHAVFGVIYDAISGDYPGQIEKLPILQLPDAVREQDPNLKYKAHYRLNSEKSILQIGPDVLTISARTPYPGWEEFSSHIFHILRKIIEKNVIARVTRIGHRYVNFFEGDVFKDLNINISLCNNKYNSTSTTIRSEIMEEGCLSILQLVNSAILSDGTMTYNGTIIDIDTIREFSDDSFLSECESDFNKVHLVGKKIFFSLLTPKLLNKLKPIYNE